MMGSQSAPNVFLAGFPKCGTTSTAYLLDRTGVAALPRSIASPPWPYHHKEPGFMFRTAEESGVWWGKTYLPARYRLDATPSYVYSELALRRMGTLDCWVILLLRHPVSRATSWWNHHQHVMIREDLTTHWGLPRELTLTELVRDWHADQRKFPSCNILTGGEFPRHIANVLRHIPKERVHIAFLEDMQEDHAGFFSAICNFLRVPDKGCGENVNMNPGPALMACPRLIEEMQEGYEETIKETEKLVGRLPESWYASPRIGVNIA